MFPKKSKMDTGFDSCRFDFRIDTKNGLTPSRRKKIERRTGYNTLFKCKTCGSLFDSRPALLTHKLTHNPVNEWTCPICDCQSAGKMTLEQHLRKTHCIGSAPAKKLSAKGTKNAQFNLTPEEIQTMVKNSEAQAQLSNIKVYEDEIITTQGSPVPETQSNSCDKDLQRPLLAPATTANVTSNVSTSPIAPPGMVCVNVPIYIGPQGARPQFIPQNPFTASGNPPASVIQVMPNMQGGHFINAIPQAQFSQLKPENEHPILQNFVKIEPKETVESGKTGTSDQSNLTEIKQNENSTPMIEVKQEPIDTQATLEHIDPGEYELNEGETTKQLLNTDISNQEELNKHQECVSDQASTQDITRIHKSPSPDNAEYISLPPLMEIQEDMDSKRSLEEDLMDREGSNSPKIKKPKLGCINMTVEKLWQNRKRTNDNSTPESDAMFVLNSRQRNQGQNNSEINIAPIVIEPLEPEVVMEENDYFVPQQDVDPNRLPSAIHLEIKEQYMQYARGRKRKVKDPYCTAMFHTCRICKQLFDSSERMWAHMLTHEEMYCKSNQILHCAFCKFTTDSETAMKQHKFVDHGEEAFREDDLPLNLSLPKETSFVNYQNEQPQKRDLLSGSRLFTNKPSAVHVDEIETHPLASGSNNLEDEGENMWECDFCDFISAESYQVVKKHMAEIHGYYMDVISHRPEREEKPRDVPFVPISVTSSGTGHVITLDPAQIQNPNMSSDGNSTSDLISMSEKGERSGEQSPAGLDMIHTFPSSVLYGNNTKKEVEKSADMQEESGFFHYSKKQWRHMTQNQTNISIQDAVQSDEPMETTFHMCKICKKLFNTIWDKWEHNYLVHRESHCKLHCPWCNFVSFSRKKLQKHVEVAHPDVNEVDSKPDGKPHVCEICGNTYVSLVHYRLHLLKHGEDGPPVFQCPYDACNMKYHTKSGLRNHMKRVHMDTGSEEQRTCPFEGCGKQFSVNGMKRHLACHSEERPVVCKYPGCGQSFREVKHLRVHWLQHTDEKPMSCEICDYTCRQRSSMNWHMKSRHGLTKVTGIDGKTTYA